MTSDNHCANRLWRYKHWQLPGLGLMFGLLVLGGCKASQSEASGATALDRSEVSAEQEEARVWMTVGEHRFAITLADTEAARAFAAQLPLTLEMADLNSNEKHADLRQALPTDSSRPGMINNGDLMLYGSSTVVLFYKTFRSTYAYTRLGRVVDPEDLHRALGPAEKQVAFTTDGMP